LIIAQVVDRSLDDAIAELGVALFVVEIFFSLGSSIPCFVTFVSNLYF
jgi:hypothetical protein